MREATPSIAQLLADLLGTGLEALHVGGEVTGDVTPDDVLGSIFANFCVGK